MLLLPLFCVFFFEGPFQLLFVRVRSFFLGCLGSISSSTTRKTQEPKKFTTSKKETKQKGDKKKKKLKEKMQLCTCPCNSEGQPQYRCLVGAWEISTRSGEKERLEWGLS